jgi:hypothetical protein
MKAKPNLGSVTGLSLLASVRSGALLETSFDSPGFGG